MGKEIHLAVRCSKRPDGNPIRFLLVTNMSHTDASTRLLGSWLSLLTMRRFEHAEEESEDELRNNFAGLVFAAAQFNKNRSFFQGISNLLSAASEPERFGRTCGTVRRFGDPLIPRSTQACVR